MSPYKNVARKLSEQTWDQQQGASVVDSMTKLLASLNHAVQCMDVDSATKIIVEPRDLCVLMKNPFKQFKYALHALILVLIAEDSKKILSKMNEEQLTIFKDLVVSAKKCQQIKVDEETMKNMRSMDADRRELVKQIALLWDDVDLALDEWNKNIDIVYAEKRLKTMKKKSAKKIAMKRMKEIYDGETIVMEELRKILGFSSYTGLCIKINAFLQKYPWRKDEVDSWFIIKGKNRKAFKIEYLDVCKQALQKKRACNKTPEQDVTEDKVLVSNIVSKKSNDMTNVIALDKLLAKLVQMYQDVCEHPEEAKKIREQIDEANELSHKENVARNKLREAEKELSIVENRIESFIKRYSK